jgi:DNA-binding CsgD family transcriptional regulator
MPATRKSKRKIKVGAPLATTLSIATQPDLRELPANVAILDRGGFIVDVNEDWKAFARTNDLGVPDFGLGTNYLDVCGVGAGAAAVEFGDQLRGLLAGDVDLVSLVYSCDSPSGVRWFSLIAMPMTDPRVAVMHVELSSIVRRPLTASIKSSAESIARAVGDSVDKSLRLEFARIGAETSSTVDGPNEFGDPLKLRARLTRRQQEILLRLGKGETNAEIAKALFRSPHTIKLHVSAILKSLQLQNRTQAALLASRIFKDDPTGD